MTTIAKQAFEDYWPNGAPPCTICGGEMGSGLGAWVAGGSSVREHRADLVKSGGEDLLLPGASDAGTGWTPICSELCDRFGWWPSGRDVLRRPAPIEGTTEPIEESWDGPCAVCGADCDDSDEDWGYWASHWMSVTEYRVTRTLHDDRLRADAADDSWARLCSDACERVAFPEDFIDDPAPPDVETTDSSLGLASPATLVNAARENHGGATAPVRRAARAGVATVARWCRTRLVGTGHE
ncbi:MAG: hypothetical protein ABI131_03775 [Nostocoides sp.]